MTVKVAISGFGRIGRNVLRAAAEAKRTDLIQQDDSHLTGTVAVTTTGDGQPSYLIRGPAAWDRIEGRIRGAIAARALTRSAAETPIIPEQLGGYPRLRGATALVAAPTFAAPEVA